MMQLSESDFLKNMHKKNEELGGSKELPLSMGKQNSKDIAVERAR